jgi:hypothetical protein
MKTAVILAVLAASIGAGCTGFKRGKDGTFTYGNALFTKQFSEGTFTEETRDTNGVVKKVTVKMKGFQSDGERLAEAIARGVASGANPAP